MARKTMSPSRNGLLCRGTPGPLVSCRSVRELYVRAANLASGARRRLEPPLRPPMNDRGIRGTALTTEGRMRVFVTGGTGLVGRRLVKAPRGRGDTPLGPTPRPG